MSSLYFVLGGIVSGIYGAHSLHAGHTRSSASFLLIQSRQNKCWQAKTVAFSGILPQSRHNIALLNSSSNSIIN